MADLDVIVPVYNEAESVDELVARVDCSLSKEGIDYNLIFVDDHSTDNTSEIVKKHVANGHAYHNGVDNGKLPYSLVSTVYDASNGNGNGESYTNGHTNTSKVKLLTKKGKKGKAYSILEGAQFGSAPYIAMIDGDLQYPPEALPELFKLAQKHGVSVAKRKMNGISPIRKLGSFANILIFEKMLLRLDCDAQSGLKVFKREVIDNLSEDEVTPWTLDMPLLTTARDLGFGVGTCEIKFSERKNGESKLDFVKAAAEIAQSALKLKFKKSQIHKIKPANGDRVIGAGVIHKGKRFITHSHLAKENSALQTLVPWQKSVLFSVLGIFLIGFLINPLFTLIFTISILTLIYFLDLIFSVSVLMKSLKNPPEIKIKDGEIIKLKNEELPIYTILCPLYREANILPQFLAALDMINWPKVKLDVILLLEEDDKETIEVLNKSKVPFYVRTLIVPQSYPKTKPKACNYGLAHSRGEYIVIYDAEDKPDPLQLKKAYIAFNNLSSEVICLQSKLNYYNVDDNLLTRLFTSEYSLWFDLILPGLQSIGTTIPLGGTSNHFKTKALRFLHGWDSFNVTEDCDLGVRLFKAGFKTAIIDSTTYEEANSQVVSWIRQRSRWIKGYFQTFLVHTRNPLEFYRKHGIHSLIFSLVIGFRMVFILVNPILWIVTITYFAARPYVGSFIESLYPAPIYYIGTTSLVFGNFLYFYNFMLGVAKRRNWEIMKYMFFIPFYWMLSSIAGVYALYQLATAPHYWEKTEHGVIQAKKTKLLPEVKISVGFEFGYSGQIIRKLLSGIFWPLAVVIKNVIDFIGLLEPMDVDDSIAKDKLKILIFNWRDIKHIWSGGAEVYVHELAKKWVESGHSVTLFCGWDGRSAKNGKINGINIIRRGGFYTVYLFALLYYLIRFNGKYDVIIDSENGVPFFTPLFCRQPKILIVHHVHQEVFRKYLPRPLSKLALFIESQVTPNIYRNQKIVTVSPSTKDDLINMGRAKDESVDIVSPGVNISDRRFPKTANPSFIYMGRLKPYKNIDIAISAFSEVSKKYPESTLTIAGFGEIINDLKKLTNKLNLTEKVKILGRVSEKEKQKLLSESWVAIQPSSFEGWGITVLEANASGTPVIASNVKGLKDSVIDGETGILVPARDITELSRAMEHLISNTRLREMLSRNAYQWSQRFNWDYAASKFEKVLEKEVTERGIFRGIPEVSEVI